jgi:hypothetical protein
MPEYAKDSQTGVLLKARDASKQGKYVCLCPDKHPVFLRKGLERAAHFAHYSTEEGGREVTCCGGGESEEHIEAKHRLVEMQGRFKFALKKCMECGERLWEDCGSGGKLDIEVRSLDKRWRYDALLSRLDGTQLALEVYHTHATDGAKIESSALFGVPIAEFHARDILALRDGGILLNLQCDHKWICGEKCADRRQRREELCFLTRLKKQREDQEAARMALEKKQREAQEAAERLARERKRRREEQEIVDEQARKRREIVEKIESPKKPCKDEKLYYHCEFNGINNKCFWAPLGEGVLTYGEAYLGLTRQD